MSNVCRGKILASICCYESAVITSACHFQNDIGRNRKNVRPQNIWCGTELMERLNEREKITEKITKHRICYSE